MGRTVQTCGQCGYQWSPRGRSYSIRCPACGIKFATITTAPDHTIRDFLIGCLSLVLLLGVSSCCCTGIFSSWASSKPSTHTPSQPVYSASTSTPTTTPATPSAETVAQQEQPKAEAEPQAEQPKPDQTAEQPVAQTPEEQSKPITAADIPDDLIDPPQPAFTRNWTDSTRKFTVIGKFVEAKDGNVTIAKVTGQTVTVPLDRLCENDRAYVAERAEKVIEGKVVSVTDGDTITVLDATKQQYKIRLASIDAPESTQPYSTQARQALAAKIFQQQVTIRWKERDRYGRVLGHIYLDDRWINRELVDEGWAWHYITYSDDPELASAEKAARDSVRGLWQTAGVAAPWEYRKEKKAAILEAQRQEKIAADRLIAEQKAAAEKAAAAERFQAQYRAQVAEAEEKARAYREAHPPAYQPPVSRSPSYSPPSYSGGGSVHVRGYYRKDGTYVRPHTRSRPRR